MECWDAEGGARPSSQLIKSRLVQFQSNNYSSSLTNIHSKESGFVSLGNHPAPQLPNSNSFNTPLPPTPTPSYSPSITMSPTELKPHRPCSFGSYPIYPSSLPSSPQRQGLLARANERGERQTNRSNRPTDLGFMTSSHAFSTSPALSPSHEEPIKISIRPSYTVNNDLLRDLNETSL